MFICSLFAQGHASTGFAHTVQSLEQGFSPAFHSPAPRNSTHHELIKRALTPAWKTLANDLSEYLADKLSSGTFADTLVAEVEEAVCSHAAGVVLTKALGVDLVESCVVAIYGLVGVTQPELEFLAVLYAGILCNTLVSAVLNDIGLGTDAICKEEKPCSDSLQTDVNNCGSCGNVVSR